MSYTTQEFDAVILGAGGAGMRAALEMANSNNKVAVISKVYPTRSHTDKIAIPKPPLVDVTLGSW